MDDLQSKSKSEELDAAKDSDRSAQKLEVSNDLVRGIESVSLRLDLYKTRPLVGMLGGCIFAIALLVYLLGVDLYLLPFSVFFGIILFLLLARLITRPTRILARLEAEISEKEAVIARLPPNAPEKVFDALWEDYIALNKHRREYVIANTLPESKTKAALPEATPPDKTLKP